MIQFSLKPYTIIFEKYIFTKQIKDSKILKCKIYNQQIETYNKISIVSPFFRKYFEENDIFDLDRFIHIDYLVIKFIKFISFNESFEIDYNELEHLLEFLNFIIFADDDFEDIIKQLLFFDFNEFVIYCKQTFINNIIIKYKIDEKILNFVLDSCLILDFHNYIKPVNNITFQKHKCIHIGDFEYVYYSSSKIIKNIDCCFSLNKLIITETYSSDKNINHINYTTFTNQLLILTLKNKNSRRINANIEKFYLL